MEDIKVGEKLRCNDGLIGELIRIERDDIDTSLKWYVFDDGKNEYYVNKPYITKHSFNLIDLLETDDIVFVSGSFIGLDYIYIHAESMLKALKQDIQNGIKIRKVLTHESYEANCYKVKGE